VVIVWLVFISACERIFTEGGVREGAVSLLSLKI